MDQQALKLAINMLDSMRTMSESLLEILSAGLECSHPLEHRLDMSTMGNKQWKCGLCGYIYDEKMEGGDIDG